MAGTLRALGLRAAGANYESINRSIKRLSIDTTHWTGKGHLKGRANPWARRAPIIEILKRDTFYQSNKLRKRLLKENILPARCAFCGLDEWLGEKIPLELITSMVAARTTALVTFAYSARTAIPARRRIEGATSLRDDCAQNLYLMPEFGSAHQPGW